jgi:rhodanese-related sulfurtransferase
MSFGAETNNPGVATIEPEALAALMRQGGAIELIDVRTPAEYRELHAEPARLVPLDALDPDALLAARGRAEDMPLYVICRTGGRAQKACEKLRAAGCRNVVNVAGGTLAWERSGLPVVRGKKSVSLERQVRIAAGSLVFAGTLLGAFVHPAWLVVPAFVGAGLVFAGVTDTCGMGMVLAKMPWNQVQTEVTSGCQARSA